MKCHIPGPGWKLRCMGRKEKEAIFKSPKQRVSQPPRLLYISGNPLTTYRVQSREDENLTVLTLDRVSKPRRSDWCLFSECYWLMPSTQWRLWRIGAIEVLRARA